MSPYLAPDSIEATHQTATPSWGMTADGYTRRGGAPTSRLVRLRGEKRWRRLMAWQFSNAGTLFLRIRGVPHIVSDYEQPGLV